MNATSDRYRRHGQPSLTARVEAFFAARSTETFWYPLEVAEKLGVDDVQTLRRICQRLHDEGLLERRRGRYRWNPARPRPNGTDR
jgi:hypothetical protein